VPQKPHKAPPNPKNPRSPWLSVALFGAFASTTKPSFHPVFHPVTAKKTQISANGYFIK
jgi:hypothetical protein